MAGGQKVLCEPIPNLRGYGDRRYKKHVGLAVLFSGIGTFMWYYFVAVAKENRVREFYSTYDPDAAFERMKSRGIFNSVGPNDS